MQTRPSDKSLFQICVIDLASLSLPSNETSTPLLRCVIIVIFFWFGISWFPRHILAIAWMDGHFKFQLLLVKRNSQSLLFCVGWCLLLLLLISLAAARFWEIVAFFLRIQAHRNTTKCFPWCRLPKRQNSALENVFTVHCIRASVKFHPKWNATNSIVTLLEIEADYFLLAFFMEHGQFNWMLCCYIWYGLGAFNSCWHI